MAGYVKDLESLIGALRHNVLSPEQGWAQLEGLKDARVEERQARKAGLAELLSGVQSAGFEAASEGTDLSTLLMDPSLGAARSKFGDDTLAQVLSPYFHATANPDAGSHGLSRLNTMLDPEDQQLILQDFYTEMQKSGSLEGARQAVQNKASQAYGPNVYATLRGQIDELLNKAHKSAGFTA
jgi:hypothetical protein